MEAKQHLYGVNVGIREQVQRSQEKKLCYIESIVQCFNYSYVWYSFETGNPKSVYFTEVCDVSTWRRVQSHQQPWRLAPGHLDQSQHECPAPTSH